MFLSMYIILRNSFLLINKVASHKILVSLGNMDLLTNVSLKEVQT